MYKNDRPLLSFICPKVSNPSCGFSLIELMICLSIFVILGLYSASAYNQNIDQIRIDRAPKRLLHPLALARLEAIRLGLSVTLCPGTSTEGCVKDKPWSVGWIAFADPNQNYILDPDERLILASVGSSGLTIGWRTPDRLLFKPDGSAWPNGHFRICGLGSSNRRAVIVHLTGRARLSAQAPGNKPVRCT